MFALKTFVFQKKNAFKTNWYAYVSEVSHICGCCPHSSGFINSLPQWNCHLNRHQHCRSWNSSVPREPVNSYRCNYEDVYNHHLKIERCKQFGLILCFRPIITHTHKKQTYCSSRFLMDNFDRFLDWSRRQRDQSHFGIVYSAAMGYFAVIDFANVAVVAWARNCAIAVCTGRRYG